MNVQHLAAMPTSLQAPPARGAGPAGWVTDSFSALFQRASAAGEPSRGAGIATANLQDDTRQAGEEATDSGDTAEDEGIAPDVMAGLVRAPVNPTTSPDRIIDAAASRSDSSGSQTHAVIVSAPAKKEATAQGLAMRQAARGVDPATVPAARDAAGNVLSLSRRAGEGPNPDIKIPQSSSGPTVAGSIAIMGQLPGQTSEPGGATGDASALITGMGAKEALLHMSALRQARDHGKYISASVNPDVRPVPSGGSRGVPLMPPADAGRVTQLGDQASGPNDPSVSHPMQPAHNANPVPPAEATRAPQPGGTDATTAPGQSAPPPTRPAGVETNDAMRTDLASDEPAESPLEVMGLPREPIVGATVASPAGVSAQRPHTPLLAQHVAQQLAINLRQTTDRVTEMALDPVELGKVRMTVRAQDHAVVMTIVADRPETADLMRRHVELLQQEFRSLGYTSVSLDVSTSQSHDAFGQAGRRADAESGDPDHDMIPDLAAATAAPAVTARAADGSLDLRL